MNARDLMTENPACCTPDTSLKEVAEMMCSHDCGEIPVIENEQTRRPVGVITDRDIACRAVAEGKSPLETTARECMTENCVTVNPEASLEECCKLLEENQIRRILVVDEEGKCCGIISQADIAREAPKERTAEVLQEVSQPA